MLRIEKYRTSDHDWMLNEAMFFGWFRYTVLGKQVVEKLAPFRRWALPQQDLFGEDI